MTTTNRPSQTIGTIPTHGDRFYLVNYETRKVSAVEYHGIAKANDDLRNGTVLWVSK